MSVNAVCYGPIILTFCVVVVVTSFWTGGRGGLTSFWTVQVLVERGFLTRFWTEKLIYLR